MSLIRCEFKGNRFISLYLEKSRYEPEITEETLINFNSKDDQNRIKFIHTRFDVGFIKMYINNTKRQLKMENVEIEISAIDIHIGEKGHDCQTVSVFELEMINCGVSINIVPYLTFPNSFAEFRFENTDLKEFLWIQFKMQDLQAMFLTTALSVKPCVLMFRVLFILR